MREIRTSGSMSGSVETEHGRRILRHNRGNPETEVSRSLNHRVTPRLYPLDSLYSIEVTRAKEKATGRSKYDSIYELLWGFVAKKRPALPGTVVRFEGGWAIFSRDPVAFADDVLNRI